MSPELTLWDLFPFAGILLSIALLPLAAPRFWHRHHPTVAAAWGLAFAVPFLWRFRGEAAHQLLEVALEEYLPFLVILWGLFTVAGGIEVAGALPGTPRNNLMLLLTGTALASFVGTTGASMLLLRPLLRANQGRKRRAHVVVFFIFLVSNVGGSLTPLGDPPLFLGFLLGVPFFWTVRLLPDTLLIVSLLGGLFYWMDARAWRHEDVPRPQSAGGRLRLEGSRNLLLLGGIVGSVWLSGVWHAGEVEILGVHRRLEGVLRDAAIVGLGLLSLAITPAGLRRRNHFGWGPMREVAILFAAIFTTMVAPMLLLRAGETGPLAGALRGMQHPDHFYWATGLLSSVLDNAPAYLTMVHTQLGRFFPGTEMGEAVARLVEERGNYLHAVSAGAVFMGALTYIGNAPNFMVKAMAEEAGVAMPSFLGYIVRWSVPILGPALLLVAWLFI